ncbi:aminoglycoside phosphotransferase family protein, partial [Streptomyces sp. NPDC003514]
MDEVEVVVAHSERATLRVGGMFLKVDADQARLGIEAEAISLAPVPTPDPRQWRPPLRKRPRGRTPAGPSPRTAANRPRL